MAWVYLLLAGLLEIGWALGLKWSQGWFSSWRGGVVIATMLASIYLLSLAIRELPVGTAYAVWTGIGAAGVALLGIVLYGESAQPLRLFFIGLILIGVIGLKSV